MINPISAHDLITGDLCDWPHVVILGAGASLAAFPNGDANHKRLPLMRSLIHTLGLENTLLSNIPGLAKGQEKYKRWCGDFEACFSELYNQDSSSSAIRLIEEKVRSYFSGLTLPDHATLYDEILLSLRKKDAIFTFNWDPFLADAYERNVDVAELPGIYHLHGNVRLTYCSSCDIPCIRLSHCIECGNPTLQTPLLYPIKKKDYSSDPFIKGQWEAAREFLADALLVTVHGYSAPETDKEAKNLMREAWRGKNQTLDSGHNIVKRINVIDIAPSQQILDNWDTFQTYEDSSRIDVSKSVAGTYLGSYPRRSCEALFCNTVNGLPTQSFPLAQSTHDLHASINSLLLHEK